MPVDNFLPTKKNTKAMNSAVFQIQDISYELIQSAVEQAFNAVVITDAGTTPSGPRIIYANPAFCSLTGYGLEELLGQNPRILQGPLTNQDVIDELRECLREGRFFRGSTINYRKNGTHYTVEWNISPVKNATGDITHFVSVQQDMSQVTSLQSTSHLLAKALDAAQDAIFITNANGVIEFVNQGFEAITGYSMPEVIGRTPAVLKSGKHDEEYYRQLWQSLKAGETFRATLVNRHKNGQLIHCEETVSPVRGRDGEITHFVSIIKDLSDRVYRERNLRQQATQDALTGLLNRRAGELQLESACFSAREESQPFCIIFADIDHFKSINDTWGHPAGDTVLQSVASHLRAGVRTTDSVVRWGGEEFVMILHRCELAAAMEQAERLRERMARTPQPEVGQVTLSMGVAEIQEGEALAELIARADKALYQAKSEGRNHVRAG